MQAFNLIIAFNLGLLSTLHCLGMCGGIITALALGTDRSPPADRKVNKEYGFVFAYNSGRIISYAIAGAITSAAAQQAVNLLPAGGHHLLQIAAAGVLIMIGLHLAGFFPRIRHIEAFGIKLWRHMQPLSRNFLPVRTVWQALIVGMIWGWLPCALVYSTLLWSAASGNTITGALIMIAFGLGTLPGMMAAGVAGTGLLAYMKQNRIRRWAGIMIILFGLASPFLYTQHNHATHTEQEHEH